MSSPCIICNVQSFVGLGLGLNVIIRNQVDHAAFGEHPQARLALSLVGGMIFLLSVLNTALFCAVFSSFDEWDRSDTMQRLAKSLSNIVHFLNITLSGVLLELALGVTNVALLFTYHPGQSVWVWPMIFTGATLVSLVMFFKFFLRYEATQEVAAGFERAPTGADEVDDMVFTYRCDMCSELASEGCGKCMCSVCLETMHDREVVAYYACQVHLYHPECINRLIDASRDFLGITSCPQCRSRELWRQAGAVLQVES